MKSSVWLSIALLATAVHCGGDDEITSGATSSSGATSGQGGTTTTSGQGGTSTSSSSGGAGGEGGGAPPGPCPALVDADGTVTQDLPYGTDPRQIMDIYEPDIPGTDLLPVFVWIHGGGWQGGSHNQVPPRIRALRERGLIVASVEYRLSDTAFPTTISDVRQAIRFILTEGANHRMDATRLAVGGSSAGGHLAAMLGVAADVTSLDLTPATPEPRVDLVIDLFGPSDLLQMDADAMAENCNGTCHNCVDSPEARLVDCTGTLDSCPTEATHASPVTHVTADDAPFVVLHGTADCTVAPNQGQRMHDALITAGVDSEHFVVSGAGHSNGEVQTDDAMAVVHAAIDEHVLRCVRQ